MRMKQKKFPPRRIRGGSQAFNTSSAPQQTQTNPQALHLGRTSIDINSSNLDSNHALVGESKQGTQNDNMETSSSSSSSRTQQEQDYKRKEDEELWREENRFNSKTSLMYLCHGFSM